MIVAELEVYHSRSVAPTRRVALGHMTLPVDPPPGFGGVLLGGIVAKHIGALEAELHPDLSKLTTQLEHGLRIPQPRLRYRLQHDRIGLQRSRHRLVGEGDTLRFAFDDDKGVPAQQLLGAVYAAGELPLRSRPAVMATIRRAIAWRGPIGDELIVALAGFPDGTPWSAEALGHPVEWALSVLGFAEPGLASSKIDKRNPIRPIVVIPGRNARAEHRGPDGDGGPVLGPSRREIQLRYRKLLIEAHPDHGGRSEAAAQRIAELGEARRILLG